MKFLKIFSIALFSFFIFFLSISSVSAKDVTDSAIVDVTAPVFEPPVDPVIQLPDLVASPESAPGISTTATVGVAKTLSSVIRNKGTSTTMWPNNSYFEIRSASQGGGSLVAYEPIGQNFYVDVLVAGATKTISRNYTFLSAGTYSYRACADKDNNVIESDETNNCSYWTDVKVITLPYVTTEPVTNVTSASTTANGEITNTGGENITSRGFVFDTVSRNNPGNVTPASSLYKNILSESGSYGTGTFSRSMNMLDQNTTYYFRAYATNSVGTAYGDELSFKTTVAITVPPKVTNLNVTKSDCSKNWLNLVWDVTPGATSYEIYRTGASTATIQFANLHSNGCNSTNCWGSDTGLVFGATYTYTVKAKNSVGLSIASDSRTATVASMCRITFNKNGGETEANPTYIDVPNYNGNVGTLPEPPTRTGYNFSSWNTSSSGTGSIFTQTTQVSSSYPVYAQWTPVGIGPSVTLTPSKTTVAPGDSITLTWTPVGFTPTSCSAIPTGPDSIPADWNALPKTPTGGSGNVTVNSTTTYGIECHNSSTGASGTATVTLSAPTTPPPLQQYQLNVIKNPSNTTGSVISYGNNSILCGSDCSELYYSGETINLISVNNTGWDFAGWSGCNSTSGNLCNVRMDSNKNIEARFNAVTPPVSAVPWIDANPKSDVPYNGTIKLSWRLNSGDPSWCTLSADPVGTFNLGDSNKYVNNDTTSMDISPLKVNTTFTLTCGANSASVDVTVSPPNIGWDED